MKKTILKIIKIYQKTLSPDSGIFYYYKATKTCKYHPTCSEYGYQAVEKYGVIKGILKGIIRILKCNPFSKGGYDPLK